MASTASSPATCTPRIIIHGGAGNISRGNLPYSSWLAYRAALARILANTHAYLLTGADALSAACHAVQQLEDDPLFNSGHGAVFTTAGTNELEASVMVSRGLKKRGVGVSLLRHVRNPILLAKAMLLHGEEDLEVGNGSTRGAQGHSLVSGPEAESLAERWGLELVDEGYFWTEKRWNEHLRGLDPKQGSMANGAIPEAGEVPAVVKGDRGEQEYLPQGTVGCVVLDATGTLAVATSTGGLTNKLPGRIGDTPSLGAGFWAEEWLEDAGSALSTQQHQVYSNVSTSAALAHLVVDRLVPTALRSCFRLPLLTIQSTDCARPVSPSAGASKRRRGVAMSGTGNGDSFLRTAAVHTASNIARFSSPAPSLQDALTAVIGPGGELQQSAGDRWGRTGEGEGGIIGIEVVEAVEEDRSEGGKGTSKTKMEGKAVFDFNCGGLFRAWTDEEGKERIAVFREEDAANL